MNVKTKDKQTLVLVIFDGFGIAEASVSNAISLAKTPHCDKIFRDNFMCRLQASGGHVGLLSNTMGNSEVGHITIGAGRVIEQPLTRITKAIQNDQLGTNVHLVQFLESVQKKSKRLHIIGLGSHGRVHSDIDHLKALCTTVGKYDINVFIHLFLDGRDTRKDAGYETVIEFENFLAAKNLKKVLIATVSGRFYAMDRDMRMERTQAVISTILHTNGSRSFDNLASKYIQAQYQAGIFDEFVVPAYSKDCGSESIVHAGDAVICFNFRPDRAVQICSIMSNINYQTKFELNFPKIYMLTFTDYGETVKAQILFKPREISNTLGEVIARSKMSQLRIAETEKIAHVTYFFDGGSRQQLPLVDQCLIPSNKDVATYDLQPQMRAVEIKSKIIDSICSYDLIVANFANADMVGHTGNKHATIRAIECLDQQIGEIYNAVIANDGILVITADHGNAEQMLFHDGSICKTHTENLVPFVVATSKKIKIINSDKHLSLCDVAPTILRLLNIIIPKEMTGIERVKLNHG